MNELDIPNLNLEPQISNYYKPTQRTIISDILRWLNAKFDINNSCCTIEGYAGTGKTTIIKEILNHYNRPTAITATTHKAARVIAMITGKQAQTIQSICGLRPDYRIETFDINNVQFAVTATPRIKDYSLIFIDESSQLNTSMVSLIVRQSTTYNTKVIFVGDSYQLPPINEKLSKVFEITHKYVLTEIVRQETGNHLLELLAKSRYDVANGTSEVIKQVRQFPKLVSDDSTNGYVSVDNINFSKGVIPYFMHKSFNSNVDFVRLLAYTNNNVIQWNDFIRNNIIKSKEILIENDFLTSYNTIVNQFLEPIIINSEDYVVREIVPYTMSDTGIDGFLTRLQSLHTGRTTEYMFIVNHTNNDNFSKYIAMLQIYHEAAITANKSDKSKAWTAYYEFKNRHLTMKTIYDAKGKAIVSKDIDYGFALTIHKAQGSTFNNTFVNIANILANTTNIRKDKATLELRNKLIYVALSRASNKSIILI